MFHFKKFSIDDSVAAMKIGTDAVLLGAWAPGKNETRILDIGTGSGILALMMAQRNKNIPIDAIELDSNAAILAQQNVNLSPWSGQIEIINTSLQKFSTYTPHKYSLLICNPPFFTNSLKAPGKARNMARHNDTLPVSELLYCTSKLLAENGKAAFIFPAEDYTNWISEASKNELFPSMVTLLKSTSEHRPHRVLAAFTSKPILPSIETEINIYISNKVYSDEYQYITRDFYLNF